jgi:hypothetical protein
MERVAPCSVVIPNEGLTAMPQTVSSSFQNAPDDLAVHRAIAQFLALARIANVTFQLVDNRLVLCAAGVRWNQWRPIRQCLDEFGIPAIEAFFRHTTPDERTRLAAPAMH